MVTRLQISRSFTNTVSSWFPTIKHENQFNTIQNNQETTQTIKKITPLQKEQSGNVNFQPDTKVCGLKNDQKFLKEKGFKCDVLLKPAGEKRKLPLNSDSKDNKPSLIKKPKLQQSITKQQEVIGISKNAFKNAKKKVRMLRENLQSASEFERNVLLERMKYFQNRIDLFNKFKLETRNNKEMTDNTIAAAPECDKLTGSVKNLNNFNRSSDSSPFDHSQTKDFKWKKFKKKTRSKQKNFKKDNRPEHVKLQLFKKEEIQKK